ncbi:Rieske (2Fe-2S) protein [Streptomyces sp. NPDC013455]|uniref:Rieske (2Fe-2S) protein n=1 Tax=Streptomyces sp. NPDC013455 TaxID=3155605 RepID=UPI0033DA5066
MTQPATRRAVLATSAGALALGCVGCGGEKDGGATATAAPASSAGKAAPGGALARTSDIPEGGGTVFDEQQVVVVQPAKGDFRAFSSICPHQGCAVSEVADGTILCACHGSGFRIADGSVARGPATRPLAERPITVEGDSIRLA